MIFKNRRQDPPLMKRIKRVIKMVKPDQLDLSPATVLELLENCDREDIDVLEIDWEDNGETTKHISIKGIPIILSIKMSHLQHRVDLIGE
jgi:hypothetical protein